jgi:putative serine protease PepD
MQTLAQSVVFIQSVSVDGSGGEGTGFCAGRPDLVLTNAHVALGGATQDLNGQVIMPQDILVTLDPGRDAERKQAAKLINVDRNFDLALLQLPHGRLNPLVVGKTESLRPLDKITSIGFPRGSTMSTKHGAPEVSYMSLDVEGVKHDDEGKPTFLQVGGSTTNGNSGGPVVDNSGHVVGITTLKVSEASIALCIPSNLIETFLSKSLAKLEAEEKEGSNVP